MSGYLTSFREKIKIIPGTVAWNATELVGGTGVRIAWDATAPSSAISR
jgi:hypothetical protein